MYAQASRAGRVQVHLLPGERQHRLVSDGATQFYRMQSRVKHRRMQAELVRSRPGGGRQGYLGEHVRSPSPDGTNATKGRPVAEPGRGKVLVQPFNSQPLGSGRRPPAEVE